MESKPNGERWNFEEVERTPAHVELKSIQRDYSVRLFADRAEIRGGVGPYRNLFTGSWKK